MTDEVKDAPQVDAPEPQEKPTPAVPSAGLPEKGSAPEGPDVSTIVEAATKQIRETLKEELDDMVDARFKSGKDRRFAKVDEIYQWVEAAGGDVKAIKSDMEISQLREEIANLQKIPARDVGTSPQLDSDWNAAKAKAHVILQGAGIALDDPQYDAMVNQYAGQVEPADWTSIVETFVKSRRSGSPAAVVAEGGASAPVSGDQESISQRLMAATLSGAPSEEIAKLQEALEAAIKS